MADEENQEEKKEEKENAEPKVEKEENEKEEAEAPPFCSVWARNWSKAMPSWIIEKAIKKEVIDRECVEDILKERKKAKKK